MDDKEVVEGEEAYLTPRQAGLLLGVKSNTLQHWNNIGKIKAIRLGSGHRRYPYSEVRRILAEGSPEEFMKKEGTFEEMAVKEVVAPLVRNALNVEEKERAKTDPNLKIELAKIKAIKDTCYFALIVSCLIGFLIIILQKGLG